MNVLCQRFLHPVHDLPLLRVGYTRRVKPVRQLVLRSGRVMPDQSCCEVLRHPCALTLGNEPLASGVEDGPVQLTVEASQVGIPLHHLIDMRGLVRNYGAVCLLRRLWFAYGAIGTGCGVMLAVRGCWNAISTHASISSSIEPLLSLSGANY